MKEEPRKEAASNRVEVLSTKEFYLEDGWSRTPMKLLSITVKAHK